jgi:hypothetical protein
MHQNGQVSDQLPDFQDQTSLMQCECSVSESGRKHIAPFLALIGRMYIIYECLQTIALKSNNDTKQNIVDTPLTLILPRAYLQLRLMHFGVVYP